MPVNLKIVYVSLMDQAAKGFPKALHLPVKGAVFPLFFAFQINFLPFLVLLAALGGFRRLSRLARGVGGGLVLLPAHLAAAGHISAALGRRDLSFLFQ